MSWIWHAAYVKSKSQDEVANAIQTTAEAVTKQKLNLAQNATRMEYRLTALARQFLCVSPQEKEWTAFWGATHRFCSLVFEYQSLSGLLIGGEDEDIEEADYSNYWYYMVWKAGVIADWFVWKPRYYFSTWSEEMRRKIALPYLDYRFPISEPGNQMETNVLKLIEKHPEAFAGDLNTLRPFVKSDLSGELLKEWLTSRARNALTQSSEILNLPFVGPDYDVVAMATYYDVQRGVFSFSPQDPAMRKLYEWGKTKIPRINEFKPLAFLWIDGTLRSPLLDDFNDAFYWG